MKKKTAALLDNKQKKLYHIEIECTHGAKTSMIFQDAQQAQEIYEQYRSSSVFCKQWIKEISQWTSDENTFIA
jgi:hypothetical protein